MKGRAISLGFLSVSKNELHKIDVPYPHFLGTEVPLNQNRYLGNNHHGFVKSSSVRPA